MDKDPLLCSRVVDYEQHLKTVISELDLDWIATSMSLEDYTKSLKEYLNSDHNTHDEINRDAIDEMICITKGLSDLQEMIITSAKRGIFEITASKL